MQRTGFRQLSLAVIIMVAVDASWTPTVLLSAVLAPAWFAETITPIATGIDGAAVVFKFTTMILFAIWLYRAGRNLVQAGVADLEFTPASRIWWFFIPFANLVKPFGGMRELENASRGEYPYDLSSGLVSVWWGLWLVNGVLATFVNRMQGSGDPGQALFAISSAFDVALAVAAIMLVRRITHAQSGLATSSLGEIFA